MQTYENVKLEIVELNKTDLICTSQIGEDDGSNDGEWI